MARKITQAAVAAFYASKPFRSGNTSVELPPLGHVVVLKLHGNAIARGDVGNVRATLEITDAGWPTRTTRERLNGLDGVSLSLRRDQWFLNGQEWTGNWTRV